MALFSNTLWGRVEGSASQGSKPGTFSGSIAAVTAALQPLNPQRRYLTQYLALSLALLKQELPSRTDPWWKLLDCPQNL